MEVQNADGAKPQGGTLPPHQGDNGKAQPKTFTEDEVKEILRGQGSKIKQLEDALGKFTKAEEDTKRKQLEEQGKYSEILAQKDRDLAARDEQLKSLTERETSRLEKVTRANEKRMEALPKDLRALVPPGLAADDAAEQIAKLEALAKSETVNVHGGAGRGQVQTDEDRKKAHAEEISTRAREWVFGPSNKDSK